MNLHSQELISVFEFGFETEKVMGKNKTETKSVVDSIGLFYLRDTRDML